MANQSDRTGFNFNSNTAKSTTNTGKNKTNPQYKGDQHKGSDKSGKGGKQGGCC